jgi:hypothetical protein
MSKGDQNRFKAANKQAHSSPEFQAVTPTPGASNCMASNQKAIQEDSGARDRLATEPPILLYGAEFSTRPPLPWGSVILGIMAIASGAGYFFDFPFGQCITTFNVSALGCFAIAAYRLRRVDHYRFDGDGLQVSGTHYRIPLRLKYGEIVDIHVPDPSRERFDIYLLHREGFVTIPRSLEGNCRVIFEFLRSQCLAESSGAAPECLHEFKRKQAETHGADKVHVFRTNSRLWLPNYLMQFLVFAMAGTALIYGSGFVRGHGALEDLITLLEIYLYSVMLGLGICLVLAALIAPWVKIHDRWRKERALVVTPGGIATVNGTDVIILSWSELTVGNDHEILIWQSSWRKRIDLRKGPVRIRVRDVFHWPLSYAIEKTRLYRTQKLGV